MSKLYYFFSSLLAALLMMVGQNAEAQVKIGSLYYSLDCDSATGARTACVTNHSALLTSGDLVIPEQVTYDGNVYLVTSVGDKAFNHDWFTSVTMPSVTSVGVEAFYECGDLATVDMPNVTSIGGSAFYGCDNLNTIEIPNVKSIGKDAFSQCKSLKTVDMPNVTSIGDKAFCGCGSLTTVDLPNLTSIGKEVFKYCRSLSTVKIPNVTSIGGSAFYGCRLNTIEIPNVKSIGPAAFGFSGLNEIAIPSITSLGDSVFYGCNNLTSVDMPNVTSIGKEAFRDCNGLTSVDMPNVTSIGKEAFRDCYGLTTVDMPKVTSIGEWAFYRCCELATVTMPSVTSLGRSAFSSCTGLTSVSLPNLTNVASHAFSYCQRLYAIDMPKVTSIGDSAFINCYRIIENVDGLVGLTLPETLETIGKDSFQSCTDIQYVISYATTPPSGDPDLYWNLLLYGVLYVPDDETVLEAYKNSKTWNGMCIRPISDFGHVNMISLDRTKPETLNVGESKNFNAYVNMDAANSDLNFSSSDESVVAVSGKDGSCTFTAIAPGEADIIVTAADGYGATATLHVTVNASADAIHNIENTNVEIKSEESGLTLTSDTKAEISIYTLGGVMVCNFTLNGGSRTVPLAQGLYLVSVNGKATKVAVK